MKFIMIRSSVSSFTCENNPLTFAVIPESVSEIIYLARDLTARDQRLSRMTHMCVLRQNRYS